MSEYRKDINQMLGALLVPGVMVLVMWAVFMVDYNSTIELFRYGVKPRTGTGLLGILAMPFIHSTENYNHVFNNSVTFVVLGWALFYFYKEIAMKVMTLIWLIGGAWLWCLSRDSFHIGASGIIYGLAAFIFASGWIRKNIRLMGLSLIVVFLYGSMVWGLFPIDYSVSFEGHLYGAMAGVLLAFYFKGEGLQRRKYQWEIEEDLGIEPPDFEAEIKRQQEQKNDVIINYIIKKENKEL